MSPQSTIGNPQPHVAIIGAGPAGLTAGYMLSKAGASVTVLEADPEYVGGISRTARYKGFHFDIGGHRFFSKSKEVEDFWTEILPDDLLERARQGLPHQGPQELRGLGGEPVRPPPLRDLLQDLHGEGVGHEVLRDQRR